MAANSQIDICNLALTELGVNPINGFTDGTRQSGSCRLWYPRARDACLRSHPWNFARIWTALALSSFVPLELAIKPDPWYQSEIIFTGAYPIPADCIRVYRAAPYNYHYRIVGKLLYTDAPPQPITSGQFVGAQPGVGIPPAQNTNSPNIVGIEYVSRNTDTDNYDDLFVEALSLRLAEHLAFALTGDKALMQQIAARAKAALDEAWFADGAEQWQDELYDNTLTDVRNTVGAQSGSIPYLWKESELCLASTHRSLRPWSGENNTVVSTCVSTGTRRLNATLNGRRSFL